MGALSRASAVTREMRGADPWEKGSYDAQECGLPANLTGGGTARQRQRSVAVVQ